MKKKLQSIFLSSVTVMMIFGFFALPTSYAADSDFASNPNAQLAPSDCGNKGQRECGWEDFVGLINRLIQFAIYISATFAVLAFCYAGFLYLTAFGEMGRVEEAHNIFKTTIIGVIIVLLGWLLVATILKTLGVGSEFTILETGNVQTFN